MTLPRHASAARNPHSDAGGVLPAIGLMVLAMALLALSDMYVKLSARHMPVGQVMLLLAIGGSVLFALIAKAQRAPLYTRDFLHPMVIWRNLFEVMGAFGLVLGLAYVPLSIFAAIMQAAPLVVTMGGALILREHVGPRRWIAVAIGIAGMLLVLRPGAGGAGPEALFAVMGVVGLALRDLVTRLAPSGLPSITLSLWGFVVTIPFGGVLMGLMGTPFGMERAGIWPLVGAIIVTTLGYYAVTSAMRRAPVSIVAPFRYTRLVFTMGLGIAVFGERPDALTFLGAGIILAAGGYTFWRERQLARQSAR